MASQTLINAVNSYDNYILRNPILGRRNHPDLKKDAIQVIEAYLAATNAAFLDEEDHIYGKTICDADDWVELDMYEKLYKASEGKADVVSCGIYEEWGDTTTECKIVDNDSGLFRPDYFYNIRKIIGNKPCLPAGIYKRTFVIGNHLIYRNYAKYDDTSLLFRIRTNAKLYAIVSECLYHYRKNNPNSGSLTDLNTDGLREQYRYMREYDCIKGLRLECEITAIQFYGYLWHLSRFEDAKDREKFLKIMSKDLAAVPYRRDMFNSEDDYELFKKIREGRAKLKLN